MGRSTSNFPWMSKNAKVPNGVDTLPKISAGRVWWTNVTDRRQTDGRQHMANVKASIRSLKLLGHDYSP